MTDKIRWGILGTGNIAREFAKALRSLDDADIVAVGSRARATADAFGDAFGIKRRHTSYAVLAGDPEVDIVYVATPHALHRDNSIRCLEGGKAVLCEKPFAINCTQAEEMINAARACRRFIMEAMWMRFIPAVQQAMAWISEGAIGEVRMLQASFGFRDDAENLFNPDLGGGSLLDVGIYPITLAHMAFGRPPSEIRSLATLGRNDVDEQAGMVLGFENGGLAVLASAIQTNTPHDACIMGTDGMITLHDSFWNATRVSLQREGAERVTRLFPLRCNGYEYEAEEAQACVRAGFLESSIVPHRATLEILSTMDSLRAQWGLRYPMEN